LLSLASCTASDDKALLPTHEFFLSGLYKSQPNEFMELTGIRRIGAKEI